MHQHSLSWIAFLVAFSGYISLLGCNYRGVTPDSRRAIEQSNPGLRLYCNPQTLQIEVSGPYSSSGLSERDCSPSVNDDPPGSSISQPVQVGGASAGAVPIHRLATSLPAHLQDDYPNLLPLPFGPSFTPASTASYAPACTPNTFVYSVNHFDATVDKIATCPLLVAKTISVCTHPLQVQITPDGSTAVVSCFDNAIAFIDTTTDNVTQLPTGNYYPNGVALSPDGAIGYFTNYGGDPAVIFMVNMATRKLMPQTLTVSSFPKSVFLTPDGAMLWVNFPQSSSLYIVDTLSMTVAGTVDAGGTADTGLAFSPNGTRAYVSVTGGSVTVFDTATLKRVASIKVADQPTNIVVTKDGSTAYVNSFSSSNPMMSVIDTASNTVIATIPQTGPAMGLAIIH